MVTPLKITFPKTRDHLWDSSCAGETMDIFAICNNRLRLQIRVSTLRLAVQHCRESGTNSCFLLGSAVCSSEEQLVLSVDRFDPGVPTHSMDLAPTDVLEGDIPVRTSICLEEFACRERLSYSERELEEAIETLSQLISQNPHVSLDMFLTLSLSILPSSSPGAFRLRAASLLSGAHLLLHQIPSVPVLPTALARNLTGPNPIYEVQQRTRSGYLTMDESRRLMLLLDSDPKAPNFPIVGVWVGGASSVRHPAVWASCMQYAHTELLRDRAAAPARGFLLVLYSGGAACPAFFQCRCQQQELFYSFLSAEACFYPSQEDSLLCELTASSQPVSADSLRLDLLSKQTPAFQQSPAPYPAPPPLPREDSLLNLSLIESVASRTDPPPHTDRLSFCQQVTSSMLLTDPAPPPVIPLSPLQTPSPALSAVRTAELLREQQLKIDSLQAQIHLLMRNQTSLSPPPPATSSRPDSLLQLTSCSTLDPSLPSLHHNDLPSFLSQGSSRSSALREITPCLLALSPPEPDRTETDTLLSLASGGYRSADSSSSRTREQPILLFSSEFIRDNETHREQIARQQTPSLHSGSILSEPTTLAAFPTSSIAPYHTSPLLETAGLSSIYIPRIQYRAPAGEGEESFLSERDPSDQLALKYLEGRSILLDPSVQQLSFMQRQQQLRTVPPGLNGISGVSVDTRAYLKRHNLAGDK